MNVSVLIRAPGRLLGAAVVLGAAATVGPPATAQAPGVPLMRPPLAAPAAPAARATPGTERTISWDALVPADWDPFKDFKDLNFQTLDDGDPRAVALLQRMRQVWDQAPVNTELVGQTVRLPGFVVPLQDSKDGLTEFLLVPYFGACIHSPPPPANQIVHVVPKTPVRGVRSMDTVWVSGVLGIERTDSYMGAAGYRIQAVRVLPYQAQAPAR